ncbi:hypothetical protein CLOM_g115 [Closterium sp. NIES-68]|nr:hypothetical protein CLOM_g115 [Closterium sp. NIES-68]
MRIHFPHPAASTGFLASLLFRVGRLSRRRSACLLLVSSCLVISFYTSAASQTCVTSFLRGSGILASLVISDSSESCPGIFVQLTVAGNVESFPLSLMVEQPNSAAAAPGGAAMKTARNREQLFRFDSEWVRAAPTVYSVHTCQPDLTLPLPSLALHKAYLWPAEMEWWVVASGEMTVAPGDPLGDSSPPPHFRAPKYGAAFAREGVVYGGAYVSELQFISRVELSYTITLVGPSNNPDALELVFFRSPQDDRPSRLPLPCNWFSSLPNVWKCYGISSLSYTRLGLLYEGQTSGVIFQE